MTTIEMIQLFLGSGGLIVIVILFFRMGKIVQKIENIDTSLIAFKKEVKASFDESHQNFNIKFNEMKEENAKKFLEIKTDIKDINRSVNSIEVQIGKLETRVEERTLRVVKDTYLPEPAVR